MSDRPANRDDGLRPRGDGRRQRPMAHAGRRGSRRRGRIALVTVLAALIVLVVVGGLAAWKLYQDANEVRADLEMARAEITTAQSAVGAGDTAQLAAAVDAAVASADRAVSGTKGALWSIGEALPEFGENFRAVRVIAESVQSISVEVGKPAAALVTDLSLAVDPATDAFDVSAIREARDLTTTARATLDRVAADLHQLDSGATIEPVASAIDEFSSLLASARSSLPPMEAGIAAASMVLGVDGPRTIDLAFMNSAEASGLGGGPSAQILVTADQGRVSFGHQPASTDFENGRDLGLPVEDSVRQLYDTILTDNINASTSRPDLPYSATILDAWWQRDMGAKLDGIVLTDPMALAAILSVTGPVVLPDGTQLDSTNAVPVLLNQAYAMYPEPAEQDAFFKAAALTVFDRLLSGGFEARPMIDVLVSAASNGHLMIWSADPTVQASLDGTRVQGTLPTDNGDSSIVGIYFRDRSSSKGDFYLHTDATVTTDTCIPDAPTYTVDVNLRFELPEGGDIPDIAYSQLYDFWRTEVFLYGPVGASTANATIPAPALNGAVGPLVDDLGRPVAKFTIDSDNGQQATVSATFAGTPGEAHGPTEARTTPMINPTTVTMAEASCD